MKIAWFCIPAHGHTNPTLALVKEMVDSGHEVFYFSFEDFKEKIEKTGATYISCDDCNFEMKDKDNAERVAKDIAFATELLVNSTLALDEMIANKIKIINPDLIISDSVSYWGKLTAIKYSIPYISSTTTFAFNKYSSAYMKHGIGELVKMMFSMPKVNKQLKRLRQNGYPVKNILDIIQNDNETNTIVYTSKFYQPCSNTFSDKYCFIGPSIRPIETPFEKTSNITIFISMGTIVKNQKIYRYCIDAFSKTDYQVIISASSSNIKFEDLPDNIRIYDFVDQMAVLSITDVFITHCGMNSASEGLYFEVPLVLCPQTSEEEAVAKRTEELGAGIWLKSINNSSNIINTVNKILNEPSYKQAALEISKSFKECKGAKEARNFIEKTILN
ncbi:UDP-Glycosyltransferase/glycogen phosphorylase [Piromyces finnis]|uniref:UDP-Glycosyltransferase/glycogen phosphorylase n=1 Tax=Piromyces finnis TaxID=1754191 RepID=A0A1Y1VGQ0_9FUNG|nr:UDP-Glycosyltransferase/glycogen phosphorylase [Piromyces finnis]|eukprot:ORX55253.1 UDP-Glycosyltransferase/glycogen phosphorylase [Piromyces finnis]